jgi:hypothetical protein
MGWRVVDTIEYDERVEMVWLGFEGYEARRA